VRIIPTCRAESLTIPTRRAPCPVLTVKMPFPLTEPEEARAARPATAAP
jgi:hypothetical protein